MKQKNAFPPNFIHSLDSSHMMLTSLFCEREGITFVSVHDCFWTHPSSVAVMNKVCLPVRCKDKLMVSAFPHACIPLIIS